MKTSIGTFGLISVLAVSAYAEGWHCELKEVPPGVSSFIYDIFLDDPLTARVEVSPTKFGVKPIDDAEVGTARLMVVIGGNK